jgi:phytanoyl-CoA hydroxylase
MSRRTGEQGPASVLDSSQVVRWREHGFLLVGAFWEARVVEAMQVEAHRLLDAGLLRNVATVGDGTTHSSERVNLQLDPVIAHSTFFRMLAFHPRAAAAVESLIGSPIVLEEDQLFWKPPRCGVGTSWHTDNSYFRLDDPFGGTAMWTAIHDATLDNGTLRVVVDGFRDEWEHERDPGSDHHLRTAVADRDVAAAELAAGGVAFFCYATPHATGDNCTDHPRAAVAFHYTNAASRPIDARDPFVTGSKADPLAWDEERFERLLERLAP